MSFRDLIESRYGTLYGFCKKLGLNESLIYAVATRKRAASVRTLEQLKTILGPEVADFFDADRVLIRR